MTSPKEAKVGTPNDSLERWAQEKAKPFCICCKDPVGAPTHIRDCPYPSIMAALKEAAAKGALEGCAWQAGDGRLTGKELKRLAYITFGPTPEHWDWDRLAEKLAAPPAPSTASELRELVKHWRERAEYYSQLSSAQAVRSDAQYFEAKPRCYKECADELAALADRIQPGQPPSKG